MLLVGLSLCCMACTTDIITVTYADGSDPVVSPAEVEGMKITVKNGGVKVKDWRTDPSELTFVLKGESSDGSFKLNTEAKTTVRLEGLRLTSQEGAPLHLKTKKKATVVAAAGTENVLTITACEDTAKHKAAAVWAKDKLLLSGTGVLNVLATGNGCKGINAKGNLTIEDLTLNVQTTGDNLGVDTTRAMGPGGPPPGFDPENIPEEVKAHFEEMQKRFEEMAKNGEMPMMGGPGMGHPNRNDDEHAEGPGGGFPPMGGGPGGKQKYIANCKGIKSKGTVTINSGTVTVTTASRGAEGIEGKEGVIINGGEVSVRATDDGINSGGQIVFNGGRTQVVSTGNDAVDSNFGEGFGGGFPPPFMRGQDAETAGKEKQKEEKAQDPAIVINGGEVLAWSQCGPPEEGLDCDFSPIQVSGGIAFSIGTGMGEMPSVPTTETAKQPTALLVGLNITEGKPVQILDAKGAVLYQFAAPFSFQRSSSLVTHPAFKLGSTYTVKCGDESKTFEMNESFTVVR